MPNTDISALLESWELTLRYERKSAKTIRSYQEGVLQYTDWCKNHGYDPDLSKESARGFVNFLLYEKVDPRTGRTLSPATALARQTPVKLFSKWLAEEGEIERDELYNLKRVKLDEKIVPSLSEEEFQRLLNACNGKSFVDIRDKAIVMFMYDTYCRAEETISIQYTDDDLNLKDGKALVRKGKGGSERLVFFQGDTAHATDKYIRRCRGGHPKSESSTDLWLGDHGQAFSYSGLYRTLKARGRKAGLSNFHPHILRHTGVSHDLKNGMSEGAAQKKGNWKQRSMMDRYAASVDAQRAQEESRRINSIGRFKV